MSTQGSHATGGSSPQATEPEPTAWVGVIVFGGLMLFLLGVFHLIQGIVALTKDTFYIARVGDLVVAKDYTAWGWLHIALGVLALAAGIGVFTGALWARVAGVVVALVSALSSMLFMPAYPVWGIIMITFDVVVIYALVAHGREVRGAKLY
ncbi:DUF7144 family membrane protein [Paractinoplanes globisporus]|uniref:DUF7144 domain-containing protein n=1 Tax=Paractinoplanes globisporus TaxID=113565 RepID=A0ABW6WTF5_9ACTN|nr:hypothetical protein [Actinoplanes globisporus]